MTKGTAGGGEFERQNALLHTPIGAPFSGAARYGAAMYFYQRGDISAEALEVYRRCCKLDHEDPVDLMRFLEVSVPPFLLHN